MKFYLFFTFSGMFSYNFRKSPKPFCCARLFFAENSSVCYGFASRRDKKPFVTRRARFINGFGVSKIDFTGVRLFKCKSIVYKKVNYF